MCACEIDKLENRPSITSLVILHTAPAPIWFPGHDAPLRKASARVPCVGALLRLLPVGALTAPVKWETTDATPGGLRDFAEQEGLEGRSPIRELFARSTDIRSCNSAVAMAHSRGRCASASSADETCIGHATSDAARGLTGPPATRWGCVKPAGKMALIVTGRSAVPVIRLLASASSGHVNCHDPTRP
jgi:hypothetical protein